MTTSNSKRHKPVYSETLPPRLIEAIRALAHAHGNTVSAEIEKAIRVAVSRGSVKGNDQ